MKRFVLTTTLPVALVGVSLIAGLAQPQTVLAAENEKTKSSASAPGHADKVARGKYLVTIAACNDCHTPLKMGPAGPEPDMSRMLSGHPDTLAMPPAPTLPAGPWAYISAYTNTAWAGPWGVSFTANLTPDPETGLGKWTLRNLMDSFRSGRHQGRGRPILPPMPIANYKEFTDADIEAVYSYLQSIPAVKNRVPEPLPPAAASK